MGRLSAQEAKRRAMAKQMKRDALKRLRHAFSEQAFVEEAALVVFTRGQMNGIRATLRRLEMGK